MMDTIGTKEARAEIAMIKFVAPNACLGVLDRAIQAHGGAGVSQNYLSGRHLGDVRTLRLADVRTKCTLKRSRSWNSGVERAATTIVAVMDRV